MMRFSFLKRLHIILIIRQIFDVLIQNFDCALSHPDANDLEYKNPLELNFYPVQEDFLFFTFLANSLKDYNFSNFSKNATYNSRSLIQAC